MKTIFTVCFLLLGGMAFADPPVYSHCQHEGVSGQFVIHKIKQISCGVFVLKGRNVGSKKTWKYIVDSATQCIDFTTMPDHVQFSCQFLTARSTVQIYFEQGDGNGDKPRAEELQVREW